MKIINTANLLKTQTLILYSLVGIVFIQPLALKLFGKVDFVIVNYIDDFFYAILAVVYFFKLKVLFQIREYVWMFLFFIMYLFIGLISSVYAEVSKNIAPALLQSFLDLKTLIIFSVFFLFTPTQKTIKKIEFIFKLIIVLNIPLILFQLIAPAIYNTVFDSVGTSGLFHTESGTFQRCVGIFWHPGQLAFFSAVVFFYFVYINKNRAFYILSLCQLFLSLQRQELVTALLAYFLILFFYKRTAKLNVVLIILAIITFIGAYYFSDTIFSYIDFLNESMSLNRLSYSIDPRIIFYTKSFTIAYSSYPLGIGLGNFGGYAAQAYHSKLYNQLYFDDYWWYRQEEYLTDTYYPHILAESGFWGMLCYILFLLFLALLLLKSAHTKPRKGAVLYAYLFIVIASITAPNINDVFSLILVGLIIATGIWYNRDKYVILQ